MRRFLVAVVIGLTTFSACAEEMDRATCFGMANAYGYIYESVKAGKPRAEVEAHLMKVGAASGMERERLEQLVTQSVWLAYSMPSMLTVSPKEAMERAAERCPKYPERLASR